MSTCLDCWEQTEEWLKANAPDFVYESAETLHNLAVKQKKLIEYQNKIIQLKEQLICALVSDDDISPDETDRIIAELEQTDKQVNELID